MVVNFQGLCKAQMVTALRFLPALGWTALIFWLSSPEWGAPRTAGWLLPILRALLPWAQPEQLEALHWVIRKTAHAGEYAVLAGLWRHALGGWRAPLALSALTAVLDELRQSATAEREGSLADVLLDCAGAGLALVLLAGGARATADRLTSALLWMAAAGGTALLLVGWVAQAPQGWLILSTPAAWIALYLWRRRRRSE